MRGLYKPKIGEKFQSGMGAHQATQSSGYFQRPPRRGARLNVKRAGLVGDTGPIAFRLRSRRVAAAGRDAHVTGQPLVFL
jgi:hypothetical protein